MPRKNPVTAAPTEAHTERVSAETLAVLDDIAQEEAEVRAAVDLPATGADGRALADFIDAHTSGTLVLFPFLPREPDEDKTYPALKGYLDCQNVRVPVSAFEQRNEFGRLYLSLAIGERNQVQLGGILLRAETQDPGDGRWHPVPGKKHDRFGWLRKQRKTGADYETIFELRIAGTRRLSAAGRPFIRANVRPVLARGEGAMEACF